MTSNRRRSSPPNTAFLRPHLQPLTSTSRRRPTSTLNLNLNQTSHPSQPRRRRPRPKSSHPQRLDAIHRCPICGNGLVDEEGPHSMRENFQKYKRDAEIQRRKLEDGWGEGMGGGGRSIKRGDGDTIVVATCGELFHKKCLLQYCSSGSVPNSGSKSSRGPMRSYFSLRCGKPCPRCNAPLMYSQFLEIDLDALRPIKGKLAGGVSNLDKSYDQLRFRHQELLYNRDQGVATLNGIEDRVKKARATLEAAKQKQAALTKALPTSSPLLLQTELELCRRRRCEKIWIENYISKAQRVIEFMQKETPNTMRLYLQEVIADKPLDEIPKRTQIPRMLIPYLHQIAEDDYCLFALSQIVEPRPYPGTTFEIDDLLLGILKKVNPSLGQKLMSAAKRSGRRILPAYDELFPDTCLQVLRSYRDLRKAQSDAAIKDSNGNELEITIMYVVDDDEDGEGRENLPEKQCIMAEKASKFDLVQHSNQSFVVISDSELSSENKSSVKIYDKEDDTDETGQISENFEKLPELSPTPTPPFSDNEHLKRSVSESKLSIMATDSSQPRDSFTVSEQKMLQSESNSCTTDDADPVSTVSSIQTLPAPPYPFVQGSNEEDRLHQTQQLKTFVVNSVLTKFDPGAVTAMQLQRPTTTRIDTQIQTEHNSTSSSTESTSEGDDEEFIHIETPAKINYGEMTPVAWLHPPTPPSTLSTSPTRGTEGRKMILAVDSKLLKNIPESSTRSVDNIARDHRHLSLPDEEECLEPPVKFLLEYETPSRIVLRKVRHVPSATNLRFKDQSVGTEFNNDPIAALQVQEKISRLCLEVDPPKFSPVTILDLDKIERSKSSTTILMGPTKPYERVIFTPRGPVALRQKRVVGPLPPLPELPPLRHLPPEDRSGGAMQIFFNATASRGRTSTSSNPRRPSSKNNNVSERSRQSRSRRSRSRPTKSKINTFSSVNSKYPSPPRSKSVKVKSKDRRVLLGGNKNFVAENIAAAFRTPVRLGAVTGENSNSKPISTMKRRSLSRKRFDRSGAPPPLLSSRRTGVLTHMDPPPVIIGPSKSLNVSSKWNRPSLLQKRKRANSNSALNHLEAKTGVLDIYSMLDAQRERDTYSRSGWNEQVIRSNGGRSRGHERGSSPPEIRQDNLAPNTTKKQTGLTRSRLINWRQHI